MKICPGCRSTWGGGRICEDCGAALVDPFGERAHELPLGVWRYIRLQYGARRGMLVRVLACLLGPATGLLLLRRAVGLPRPWALFGAVGALAAGALVGGGLYAAAGRAVRIWVLRKGQVRRARLARALLGRLVGR